MSRRKGEITAGMNERAYPHLVDLPLPPGGFRSTTEDMLAFHRERGIQTRRGRGRNDEGQFFVTYCFADPAHADAFRDPNATCQRNDPLSLLKTSCTRASLDSSRSLGGNHHGSCRVWYLAAAEAADRARHCRQSRRRLAGWPASSLRASMRFDWRAEGLALTGVTSRARAAPVYGH